MADEYFYGVTLEKAGSTATWEHVGNTKEYPSPFYKLVIRQVLLGHTAKPDEYNTVEVETSSENGSKVKVPIAVLKVGETRCIQSLFEFPDAPHTFKLVEGNGPVHILGQVVPGNYELDPPAMLFGGDEDIDEEEDEEDEDEDEDDQDENAKENCKNSNNKKKRKH